MQRTAHPEPYKIKMIEPTKLPNRRVREDTIKGHGYNVFKIPGNLVFIDLMTDSGNSAMSKNQWAGLMLGDESYGGCDNFFRLKTVVIHAPSSQSYGFIIVPFGSGDERR